MSLARGRANQSLYLARILINGWERAAAQQEAPGPTLAQAYLPAVRAQLLDAYGWFLLEVSGAEPPEDDCPPRCCGELPAIPEGKALSGEIREFSQLESGGWLAELMAAGVAPLPAASPRTRGNLASATPESPDAEAAASWHAQMATLFGRMRDSLEEC
jgi:hypothetical protein